jgi:hypothetical protein
MVHVLNSFEMQIWHWLEGEVGMNMEKVLFIWDYFSLTFTIANEMKKYVLECRQHVEGMAIHMIP